MNWNHVLKSIVWILFNTKCKCWGGGEWEGREKDRKMVTTTWVPAVFWWPFWSQWWGSPVGSSGSINWIQSKLQVSMSCTFPSCNLGLQVWKDLLPFYGLPWWELLSREVVQICVTRPGIFLLLLSAFFLQWNFFLCANSKPFTPM